MMIDPARKVDRRFFDVGNTMTDIHPAINTLTFSITDTWDEVEKWWDENPEYEPLRKRLDEPSGLSLIKIPSRIFMVPLDIRYRVLDFTGTTVRQAFQKILTFYKHKTYRREVGDHTFFEGVYDRTVALGS
jgi:hypothetical protein